MIDLRSQDTGRALSDRQNHRAGGAGSQRPRPDFEALYFEGRWGHPVQRDPAVVAELTAAGELQSPAPLPHRRQEIRAMAAMFGLPE